MIFRKQIFSFFIIKEECLASQCDNFKGVILQLTMKGQLSVDPTFKTLEIRRPTLHYLVPLVAFDGHRLHLESQHIPWQSKGIINCAYVKSLGVLMVLCNDWKLYIYNKNMELIAKLSDWESKYSVGFEYIESLGMLLLIGVIEIQTMKVNIKTNLKETKFLSSVRFNIERKELRGVEEKNRLSWNKGYGYDLAENLLYVWSTQNINFYSLNKLELRSSVTKLVKKEAAITYVHLNTSYKYTITGLINGNVKVWRLPLSPVSSAECIMIHNCNYHTKFVEKIVPSNDDRVIISAANDLTICLWSLETFELLRVYNFEGEYTQIFLVDHKRAFAIQNSQLGELTFGKTMEFISEIDSNITYFDKHELPNGENSSFQITLESNIGLQIVGKDLHTKDLNKIDIAYFYPPLKAQSIKQVLSCPYNPQIYYMLVENGQLFSVKIQNNSSKIEESFSLQHIQDSQNHSLNQTPTFISFLDICDIQFDSEITQNSLSNRKAIKSSEDCSNISQKLKLITIGCSRGSIVILSLENIQRIRARLTYHRESILSIQLVEKKANKICILASHCAEDYLRFISLEADKAHCFLTIFCNKSLKFCYSFQDKLAFVFKKGIFELGRITGPSELKIIQNLDAIDHQGQIFALDYEPIRRLIMTSGNDNRIKIWSLLKVLVFEIKLDEGLKYTIWSNDLQILVLHRNKLLYLRDMHIDASQVEDEEEIDLEADRRFVQVDIKEQFLLVKKENYKRKEPEREVIPSSRVVKRKTFSQSDNKNTDQISKKEVDVGSYSVVKDTTKIASINRKGKSSRKAISSSYTANMKAEEEQKKRQQIEVNAKAARKHMEEINSLKKQVNQSLLPKIQPKSQDKFQQFINAKLISKKMLTRRDITLNRIIMKNLIKEQFSQEEDQISSLKLDF